MMKTTGPSDFGIIAALSGRYRAHLFVIVVLSVVASCLDGISIGLLVPLLNALEHIDSNAAAAGPFGGLASAMGSLPSKWQIPTLLGAILTIIAVKNAFNFLSIRAGHRLSTRIVAKARTVLVQRWLFTGLEFHDRSKSGDFLDRIVTHGTQLETLIRMGVQFVANAVTMLALLALLFALSWWLALLAMAIGAISVGGGLAYARVLKRLGSEEAASSRDMSVAVQELLAAMRLIKSYSMEERHLGELNRSFEAVQGATYRRTIHSFALHPLTDVTASIALVALFLTSVWLSGGDTRVMLARTIPFMFVLLRIVPLLKILSEQKACIFSLWPYLNSLATSLRTAEIPTLRDGSETFPGLTQELCLEGLSFTYRDRAKPALAGVNLSIPAGKTTAIIGESGSGKSTLASLLLRLYEPQAGGITIDGTPLSKFRLESFHRRIGTVSQDTFLFHNTVRFNLSYGASQVLSDEQLIAAAKRARAHDFIMELPGGYDAMIGDRGVWLSGGQRQRLALARAIVLDPEILILDEATSALDPESEDAIQVALREFCPGRTVIVIAHRPSTIRDADQVLVLKNGRLVETRTPAAVLA